MCGVVFCGKAHTWTGTLSRCEVTDRHADRQTDRHAAAPLDDNTLPRHQVPKEVGRSEGCAQAWELLQCVCKWYLLRTYRQGSVISRQVEQVSSVRLHTQQIHQSEDSRHAPTCASTVKAKRRETPYDKQLVRFSALHQYDVVSTRIARKTPHPLTLSEPRCAVGRIQSAPLACPLSQSLAVNRGRQKRRQH